ncbi:hypothetical protein [uncultured Shewanella sp.]|nr:hypothetical protein [uncultured Shewanella sp.]
MIRRTTETTYSPSELPKYVDKNAVEPSWMMVQARGDMDAPSEALAIYP